MSKTPFASMAAAFAFSTSLTAPVQAKTRHMASQGDATTWQFKRRESVTFHDGSVFGTDDVNFSMDRV
ncbi:MAG: hypothetical protein AB8B60_04370 [Sulfitobacter sp.]